jgi:hypothetical protein
MSDAYARGTPSGLVGRLSEVYFAALASSLATQLTARLGERATLIDPLFGRASGMAEVGARLDAIARWLTSHDGAFERFGFVAGSDRDVTEGALALTIDGTRLRLPVAVVADKRREREVEVRTYYSTQKLRPASLPPRAPLVEEDPLALPPPVAAHLEALARGDVTAVVASFELGGTVRGPDGDTHAKLDGGGPLRGYYERLLAGGGVGVRKHGRADDGSTSVLEYTIVRFRGKDAAPQPGLAVYERGESGLLRTVRVYDDVVLRVD